MHPIHNETPPGPRRTAILAGILALQIFCAAFFVVDVFDEIRFGGLSTHSVFEALVTIALFIGVIFGGLEMRRTIERNRRAESAVAAASGALADLIETRFEQWDLTPSERDVALLAIKGFDVAEIAAIRGTAEGTVRAQLAKIYAKSSVTNRAQLVSQFIDDLLDTPLLPSKV